MHEWLIKDETRRRGRAVPELSFDVDIRMMDGGLSVTG